jgi:hypothetical protein
MHTTPDRPLTGGPRGTKGGGWTSRLGDNAKSKPLKPMLTPRMDDASADDVSLSGPLHVKGFSVQQRGSGTDRDTPSATKDESSNAWGTSERVKRPATSSGLKSIKSVQVMSEGSSGDGAVIGTTNDPLVMQGFALDNAGSGLYRRTDPKPRSKLILPTETVQSKRSSLGKNSSPLVTSASVYNIRSVLAAASPVEPARVLSARGDGGTGMGVEPPVPPVSSTNASIGRLGKSSSSRAVTVASALSTADRRRSEDSDNCPSGVASTASPLLFSGTSAVSPTSMSIIDKIAEEVAAETLEGIEVRRIDLRDKRSTSLPDDAELDALILGDGGSTPTPAHGGIRKQVPRYPLAVVAFP